VFGGSLAGSEGAVMERRLQGIQKEDPLDELAVLPSPRIAAWMRRKAKLADGMSPWAAIVGSARVQHHLCKRQERKVAFRVRPDRNDWDGWLLLETGLLHDLAGLGCAEIGRVLGCAGSTAGLRLQRHRRALAVCRMYAEAAGRITRVLLDEAYPRGVHR